VELAGHEVSFVMPVRQAFLFPGEGRESSIAMTLAKGTTAEQARR
jgi:hypothetical protein